MRCRNAGNAPPQVRLSYPLRLGCQLAGLKVRQAVRAAGRRRPGDAEKFSVGRHLRRLLCEAGFTRCQKRTYATNRAGPVAGDTRLFVEGYLRSLRYEVQDAFTSP